jgi:hypothetical protein
MKAVVAGGRFFDDEEMLFDVMDSLKKRFDIKSICHGAASGADTLAGKWAKLRGVPVKEFPAQWAKFGRSAGPRRNLQMLKEFNPDILVAFPGGTGTKDMIEKARAAKIQIVLIQVTHE